MKKEKCSECVNEYTCSGISFPDIIECYKKTYELEETESTENVLGSILKEADKIINGDRKDSYGNPIDSFTTIADYWSNYLKYFITSSQVAMMMILLKIAREQNKHQKDNLVDIAGYTALLDYIETQKEDK